MVGAPQLSGWTQGHWLTLGPYGHSSDLWSFQPSWEVGIRTLTLEMSNGGARTCWVGSESQTEWW